MKLEKNDISTIEEICSNTWEPLYRFIYFKVQNREEAEDITQETYFKAISYFNKNNIKIDKHIGYLKTIALNIIKDKWRKNKRQGIDINLEAINPIYIAQEDQTENIAQQELVQNALMQLSEAQRSVIELRIIKGYTVADTAKSINKSENNVRVLQFRALKNLTKILNDIDDIDDIDDK